MSDAIIRGFTSGGHAMSDRYDEGREWGQVRERAAILDMLKAQAYRGDGEYNADYVQSVRCVIVDIEAGRHKPYYAATLRLAP